MALPLPVTRKKKVMSPMPPTMKPGTKKDQPQGELGVVAQNEGIIAPGMFPIAVRDAHMPIRSPRLEKSKTEKEEHYTSLLVVLHSVQKIESLYACMSRKGGMQSHPNGDIHVAAAGLACRSP